MERVTIRDVTDVCPAAGVAGSADLRDTALAVAPRVAPAGSSRARVAEIAAALILAGVGEEPQGHGLAVDGDILARAADEHGAMRDAGLSVEERLTRVARERDAALREVAAMEQTFERMRRDFDTEHHHRLGVEQRVRELTAELTAATTARDAAVAERDVARARVAELEAQLAAAKADGAEAEAATDAPAEGRRKKH